MNISQPSEKTAGNRLSEHLLSLCQQIAGSVTLPSVDHVYLPPPRQNNEKCRKFGLVVLSDQSTGFFFTLLEKDSAHSGQLLSSHPRDPLELASWYGHNDIALRAIGLGAIGAITQFLFNASGFRPPDAINPLADMAFDTSDHVGMVGFFPGLVAKLRERGVPLTVLELEPAYVQKSGRFEVTLDPSRLKQCNKVLCTASTLINDTVDDILSCVDSAEYVALIGPSAGCLPEPLFERGISIVGGSSVTDFKSLESCCETGTDWGGSVSKYCLTPENYPGTLHLIKSLRTQDVVRHDL